MNLRIFCSRSTTIASVGVCTRPTVVLKKPPDFELKAVIARVPLMPTSQSASERLNAASASGNMLPSSRNFSKPSEWRRRHGLQPEPLDGCLAFVYLTCCGNEFAFAACVARIDETSTSLRFDQFGRTLSRFAFLDGPQSKCGGMTAGI